MKLLSAWDVARLAPYADLIAALRAAFCENIATPVRHHYELAPGSGLLLMPAWSSAWAGLKTVTVKLDNAQKGLPTIQASYLLIDNATGAPVAVMDGTEITRRRTAAAAALAADFLARPDAETLALIGAGALGAHFVRAHGEVRKLRRVLIHSRTMSKAEQLAAELAGDGFDARPAPDLEAAVRAGDIVSCVTTSTLPLVRGAWLRPGTHLDLAGAFRPSMRETDGEAVGRAAVFVDTRDGALAEAGDLIQAAAEGFFDFSSVRGDLFDLCRGLSRGRSSEDEITLFKSCGTAIEDLATAILLYQKAP